MIHEKEKSMKDNNKILSKASLSINSSAFH